MRDIWIPVAVVMVLIAFSIANSKLGWSKSPSAAVSIAYLVIRIAMAGLAGYLATTRTHLGLLGAAAAGGLVFLTEQLVVAAWFVVIRDWSDLVRVAEVFVVVVAVPMIIGVIGGLIGRSRHENAAI